MIWGHERLRVICLIFFFSSRRRHTRSTRDWSSDVCSSDLLLGGARHRDGTAECPVGRKRTGLYKGTRRPWPYLAFAHGASGEPRMQTRVENKPSTTKRMIVMIVAVLALVAVIAGIKVLSIMRMIAASKPPPPAVVSTAKATSQDWQPELHAVGTLRAV